MPTGVVEKNVFLLLIPRSSRFTVHPSWAAVLSSGLTSEKARHVHLKGRHVGKANSDKHDHPSGMAPRRSGGPHQCAGTCKFGLSAAVSEWQMSCRRGTEQTAMTALPNPFGFFVPAMIKLLPKRPNLDAHPPQNHDHDGGPRKGSTKSGLFAPRRRPRRSSQKAHACAKRY